LEDFSSREKPCATGVEPKCGIKDNRGREVPLEGIGVFGMKGGRKS
jgi:hypothetical protein